MRFLFCNPQINRYTIDLLIREEKIREVDGSILYIGKDYRYLSVVKEVVRFFKEEPIPVNISVEIDETLDDCEWRLKTKTAEYYSKGDGSALNQL